MLHDLGQFLLNYGRRFTRYGRAEMWSWNLASSLWAWWNFEAVKSLLWYLFLFKVIWVKSGKSAKISGLRLALISPCNLGMSVSHVLEVVQSNTRAVKIVRLSSWWRSSIIESRMRRLIRLVSLMLLRLVSLRLLKNGRLRICSWAENRFISIRKVQWLPHTRLALFDVRSNFHGISCDVEALLSRKSLMSTKHRRLQSQRKWGPRSGIGLQKWPWVHDHASFWLFNSTIDLIKLLNYLEWRKFWGLCSVALWTIGGW